MPDQKKHQLKNDEVVDGEIVAEFTGETFLNLPQVEDTAEFDRQPVYDNTRRDFVLRLMLGGTAALALGGGAALVYNQRRQEPRVQEVILPYGSEAGDPDLPANVAELAARVADLEYELAERTGERDQAVSDVADAETRLAALEQELADAQALLELWQSHDNVGLDALVDAGLGLVYAALRNALTVLNILDSGLTAVRSVLARFVDALPGPIDAIEWLKTRITRLSADLDVLTQQVQKAVDSAQPFNGLITEFVLWILDELPFGIGDRARAGLEAMQGVVGGLPEIVSRVNTDVLDPLATWFSRDQSKSLIGTLIRPVETQLMDPGKNVVAEFREFASYFETELVAPVQEALEARRALRTEIDAAQARRGVRA